MQLLLFRKDCVEQLRHQKLGHLPADHHRFGVKQALDRINRPCQMGRRVSDPVLDFRG